MRNAERARTRLGNRACPVQSDSQGMWPHRAGSKFRGNNVPSLEVHTPYRKVPDMTTTEGRIENRLDDLLSALTTEQKLALIDELHVVTGIPKLSDVDYDLEQNRDFDRDWIAGSG